MKKKLLFFLGAGLLLFILDKKGVMFGLRNGAEGIIVPIQYGVYSFQKNIDDQFRVLTFWRSGEQRVKDLERKNWELMSKLGELTVLQQENYGLRGQLGVIKDKKEKVVLANVIGQDGDLILDKGEKDLVKVGATVFWGKVLVGVVQKVTPGRSFILVPTDSGSKIPVKIGGVRGVVVGKFGTAMELTGINQNEVINEGDPLLTSGEGSVSKINLLVGRAGKIKSIESDVFKTTEVVRIIDFGKLEQVFIALE